MSTLNRTFSLSEISALPMFIRQDLDLDVPWSFDESLDVYITILERRRRFSRSSLERLSQLLFRLNDAHSPTASARRSFYDHGETDVACKLQRFGFRLQRIGTARENRNAGRLHGAAGFDFFTHQTDYIGTRTDELDVAGFANFREIRRLREEPITGMNRVNVENFGGADNRRNV